MFTVSTAATERAITTLERLKSELAITSSDEDAYLEDLIARAGSVVTQYLRVPAAEDGTRTVARETVIETFRDRRRQGKLILSRKPVTAIASVVEDGTTLDAADYEVSANGGLLSRLSSDAPCAWAARKVVVTFTAGWLMPADTGRDLPYEIEDAAFDLIKATRFSRSRDPALRSENILEGLYSYTLFDSFKTEGTIPPPVAAKLDPYVYPPIF